METITSRMRSTQRRRESSANILLAGTVHKDLSGSVINHAKALNVTPQEALSRAWWFYLATYEKKAVVHADQHTN